MPRQFTHHGPAPGARSLALKVLHEAQVKGASVEDRLAAILRVHPDLPRLQRAFVLELVQGVKRWEIQLDYVLAHLSHRPLGKLHPLVLPILRMAAYQILFLDRVPARAAVAEAGNLAKERRLPRALVGYINAVLRRLAAGERPQLPALDTDPVGHISIQTAHPDWLVRCWLKRYGYEVLQARLAANNQIPPLTIRINSQKTDIARLKARLHQEGVETVPCRFSPVGLHLVAFDAPPQNLPSFREGWWLFQDEAAQLTSYLLSLRPGEAVLEIGAGRGGKTTHLGERLANCGLLLAVDKHRRRLQELQHLAARWGITTAHPLQADATRPLPVRAGSLDAILIDAPCSALGIIRRHPEIKTRLAEADLISFPPRQRAMLEVAAPLLRPGGRLLYITCTTEPEENDALVTAFLEGHPEFRPAGPPAQFPIAARDLLDPRGVFRTSPEEHRMDGFFAALMVKS